MRNEIGSIFEISKDEIGNDDNLNTVFLNYLEKKHVKFTTCGREAIELAIENIEKIYADKISKKCVLPMYTCDTVIIPFENHGWEIKYYEIDRLFNINIVQLQELLKEFCPDVLFVHAYYGIELLDDVCKLIEEQQKTGMIYIEDLTQNMNMMHKKINADYYVGSLRKWFSIADGGFVSSDNMLEEKILPPKQKFITEKLEALTMKSSYLNKMFNEKQTYLNKSRNAETYLYTDDTVCEMSSVSKHLLNNTDINETYKKRSHNAKILWDGLHEIPQVRVGISKKSLINAPLYFPIMIDDRDKLQAYLNKNDVFAPVLWPIPEQIKYVCEDVNYIFSQLLALPCDYRYGNKDMFRIINLIKEYYESQV